MQTLAATLLRTLLLLLCISAPVFAQLPDDKLTVDEEFNDNSNKGLVEKNETYSCSVGNGKLTIELFKSDRVQAFWNSLPIDMSKEYIIDVRLTKTYGADSSDAFGVLWGTDNLDDSHRFLIGTDFMTSVMEVSKGQKSNLSTWRSFPAAIHGIGVENRLTIERRNSAVVFRVNGTPIYAMDETSYAGKKIGFYVEGRSKIEITSLKVYQHDFAPINELQTSQPFGQKVNLGSNVNSELSDISPVIAPDGNTLFIGRYEPLKPDAETTEQIWYSQRQADGTWSKTTKALPPLNNSSNCFVISMSPDNNSLLVANSYNADGSSAGNGVSLSSRTTNGWSVPKKIEVKNYMNRSKYVGYCLSNDRKTLLICAENNSTLGGRDINVSFMQDDGTWSEPKNVGTTINSVGDEDSPFLAADGKTLYFSSNGFPGYGGNDIYITRRLDDSWTKWSTPQNLGKAVNTSGFDAYFTIPATGDKAYLVSWESKERRSDIFLLDLPPEARPLPVILISGKVFDAKTKQPLSAVIHYEALSSGKEVGIASSSPEKGEYKIVLPAGEQYGFHAEREGYFPVSDNIDTRSTTSYKEIQRDLYLVPIEKGAAIRINNLFFDFAKATLRPESYPDLNRVADFVKKSSTLSIEIQGHTDNVGNDAANQSLSENRAKAVLAYLKSKGADAKRISSKGFGKKKPVATNDTEDGRQQNRRVEFIIMDK